MRSKRKVLGPLVVLDQERCIQCTRCVRFMAEVAKEPQLGMFGRGSTEYIDTFPGKQLNSNYSGNTVDICPVGALLNRDFRFRARSWFLSAAPSVCTGCSRGCSTFVDFMGQDTYRYRPRENEQINKSWMCDQGRLSYKYVNQQRLAAVMMGRGDDRREATVPEALKSVAEQFKALAGTEGLAVLASPVASNEDLLATLSFARDALGLRSVYVGGRPEGGGDHYLMTPDKNPNRKGLEWIARGLELTLRPFSELGQAINAGKVKALYAVGGEVPVDSTLVANGFGRLEYLVLQSSNESAITAQAHVLLPSAVHVEDEGSFTNLDGITQRFRRAYPARADVRSHWAWAVSLAQEFGFPWVQTSARDVFREWGPRISELASFDWDGAALPSRSPAGSTRWPPARTGDRRDTVSSHATGPGDLTMKAISVLVAIGFIIGALFGVSALAYVLGDFLERWNLAWLSNMVILLLVFVMVIATFLTLAERKWSAMMQNRIGPNRATFDYRGGAGARSKWRDPHVAPTPSSMLTKEDYVPGKAHKFLFIGRRSWRSPALIPSRPSFAVGPPLWPGELLTVSASPASGLQVSTSTSACSSTSPSPRCRSTAPRWPAGPRTTSGR